MAWYNSLFKKDWNLPGAGDGDFNPFHSDATYYSPLKALMPGGSLSFAPKLHGGGGGSLQGGGMARAAPPAPPSVASYGSQGMTGGLGGMSGLSSQMAGLMGPAQVGRGQRNAISALAQALVNAQMGPLALQEAQARAQASQDVRRGRSITGAQKRSARQTMRQQQALTNQSLASAADQAATTEAGRTAASGFLDQALADIGSGPYEGGPTAAEVAAGSAAAGGARRAADMGAGFGNFAAAARDVAQTGGSEFERDVLGRRSQSLAELAMQRNQVRAQQPQIFMDLFQQAQARADQEQERKMKMLQMFGEMQGESADPNDIRKFLMGTERNRQTPMMDAAGNPLLDKNGAPVYKSLTYQNIGAPESYDESMRALMSQYGLSAQEADAYARQVRNFNPEAEYIQGLGSTMLGNVAAFLR